MEVKHILLKLQHDTISSNTVYGHTNLMTVVSLEKCLVRQFLHCLNIIEYTYTNLKDVVHLTPRLYSMPSAPRLETCTACNHTDYYMQLQNNGKLLCI